MSLEKLKEVISDSGAVFMRKAGDKPGVNVSSILRNGKRRNAKNI